MKEKAGLLTNVPAGLGCHRPANEALVSWVEETVELCQPDEVFWCDGSAEENTFLLEQAQAQGVLTRLNQEKVPGGYIHRSKPNDVARVEQLTFICTKNKEDAGPTNNWAEPREMVARLHGMLRGAMRGRTLFVIPYLMGQPGSALTKLGVELTDSIYVVLNMRIVTRMGAAAYGPLGDSSDFNRGLHSLLDVNPERRYICHFPEDNAIISVGSGYGGNVLLGKKCMALRIGSFLASRENWMAEHMLLLCVESPEGEKTYVAAAFPSACGKTNFSMLIPPAGFEGWKVRTIGDDIAWMKPGPDGRLYAINPENGYFGVVPGTNSHSNPNAMKMISHDTIYTNVATTEDGDVWWEGKDGPVPARCLDWKGEPWQPGAPGSAAHPNSRFTTPRENNPALAAEVNDPRGVPISAILFGGRRATTVPLVFQSFNWGHGVYVGATMGSETTAAAVGAVGQVRRDPMAMLPFCGYHMGDYFSHWFDMRKQIEALPLIFSVNWFRKSPQGKFLWPGFGENMRVLKWIVDRCRGRVPATESPIGWLPRREDFHWRGMESFSPADFEEVQKIDPAEWRTELESQKELFEKLGNRMPKELLLERELLIGRFS